MSEEAVNTLNWLSDNHHIAFKDVIDLVETETRAELSKTDDGSCIQEIIDRLEAERLGNLKLSIRRTLSVSHSSVQFLNQLTRENKIPRNALVNQIIIYAKTCTEEALIENEELRKEALEMIASWMHQGGEIKNRLNEMLLSDDKIKETFNIIYSFASEHNAAISKDKDKLGLR